MIRLLRTGKKHDPSFRVVLTDSRKGPQSGAFLEILGNYNARKGEPQLKEERIKHWISKGAQVSDTVHNLLVSAKILKIKKKDVLHHTRIKKAKEKKKPAAPATPAEQASDDGQEAATEGEAEPEKELTPSLASDRVDKE